MAAEMLASLPDSAFRVPPDRIPFPNREQVDCLSFAIQSLGPLEGKRILEVGVGGGTLAVWMALQGARVTGIDVSEKILAVAVKRAARSGVLAEMDLHHCSIEDFPGHDRDYDIVIGNNVIHHFERDPALANIARVMSSEGRAVFCEPVLFLPEWVRQARYAKAVARRFPPHTHTPDERSLSRQDMATMHKYFGSVSWRPFQILCRLQNFCELSDPLWNRLESIDRLTLRHVHPARWLARLIVLDLQHPRPTDGRSEGSTGK